MNKLTKTLALITLAIVTLSIVPVALVLVTLPVSAQRYEITVSSTNIVEGKIVEIVIKADPGIGPLPLEVYDKDTYTPALLVDSAGDSVGAGKLVATERAGGYYYAYLVGYSVPKAKPLYPKVTLDDTLGADDTVNIAWFGAGHDGKTYVIRWIGTDVAIEVKYDYVTSYVTIDRATYPFEGWIRITINDQDLNKDPTIVDQISSDDITVTYIKVIRPSTGETFEESVRATLTAVVYGGATEPAYESAVNSGVFKFDAELTDLESYLALLFSGFVEFKKDDIIIIKLKGNTPDPDVATITFRVSSVTPSATFEAVSFAEGISISVDWFDYDVKSWSKDEIPAGIVRLELLKDGASVDIEGSFKLSETDVNTGKFTAKLDLKWGDFSGRANNDGIILVDPREVDAGSSFKLKLSIPTANVERYYTLTFVVPSVTLDKTQYYVTDTVVITIADSDLNDDSGSLESYRASLTSGADLSNVEFKRGTIPFIKLTLKDLVENVVLKSKVTKDLLLVETDVNSGVFKLKIALSDLELPGGRSFEGHTLRLTIHDLTSGKDVSVDFYVAKLVRSVTLDRTAYPVPLAGETLKVYITVTAPEWNINPDAKDSIPRGKVYIDVQDITGRSLSLLGYPVSRSFTETDINTGIFTLTEPLTNLPKEFIGGKIIVWYDVDGDALFDPDEPNAIAAFRLTTASLTAAPSIIEKYGSKLRVEIRDPDKNLDSKGAESVEFKVEVEGVPISFNAKETDANTGIFVAELVVADDGDITGVKPGGKIVVKYTDSKTAASSATAGFIESTLSVDVRMASYTGSLKTDKTAYGPSSKIEIIVTDPDLNRLIGQKDPGVKVFISIEGVGTFEVPLEETEVNSGIFKGSYDLSTQPPEDIIGKKVLIAYQDEVDAAGVPRPIIAVVNIISEDPTITFDKDYYMIGDTIKITVKDLDANRDPLGIDQVNIWVYSDSMPVKTSVIAYETDVNTGEFTVSLIVSDTFGAGRIYAKYGDKIYVEYEDKFPADYGVTGKSKIFKASVPVGVPVEKPIAPKKAEFVDPKTGVAIIPRVGAMVGISVELSNVGVVDQVFTAILVVTDPEGVVVKVDSVSIPLAAGKSGTVTFSYIPKLVGDYTVEVYIVKSLADWTPLGDMLTKVMSVVS